jgi:hypothetical protein
MIHADLIVVCAASLAGHGLGCPQRSLHHLLGLRELRRHALSGRGTGGVAVSARLLGRSGCGPLGTATQWQSRHGWAGSPATFFYLTDRSAGWGGGGSAAAADLREVWHGRDLCQALHLHHHPGDRPRLLRAAADAGTVRRRKPRAVVVASDQFSESELRI